MNTSEVHVAVDAAFRGEWGRVVAALIAQTGDWDLAEECAQEAFAQALRTWQRDGVPNRPGAWLTTVARNRALDRLRRDDRGVGKLEQLAALAATEERAPSGTQPAETGGVPDDRLRLMFTCCHPALPLEARTALTLRTLAGLTTAEIARAFLVSEPTMAKRLVRAKQKIQNAHIPYRVPPPELLPERTTGVLAVLYLLFNEGYSASAGADLIRGGLCEEAIRLATVLCELTANTSVTSEALGLLALVHLQHARRAARVDEAGDLVRLAEQDRNLWDHAEIIDALALLRRTADSGPLGPYQVQAAIATQHAIAPEAAATDWPEIVRLYGLLAQMLPSPVIELNRAVAIAMAEGPAAGLVLVEALETSGALGDYHLLAATRADLLARLGRNDAAAAAYHRALELVGTDVERRFLSRRLAEVAALAATESSRATSGAADRTALAADSDISGPQAEPGTPTS